MNIATALTLDDMTMLYDKRRLCFLQSASAVAAKKFGQL